MSDEQQIEESFDDEALIETVALLVRKAGETRDPRIADIALHATESIKTIPGIFERMLLRCTPPAAPNTPYQYPQRGMR